MRRSSHVLAWMALAFLFVLADVQITCAADDEEPTYGGKRLSEWWEGMHSQDDSIAKATRAALHRVDPRELATLISALKHQQEGIRHDAALLLGEIGIDAKKVVPSLLDALKDESIAVRTAAALSLGQFGPHAEAATMPLAELLRDPDLDMRRFAAGALVGIGFRAKAAMP